MNPSTGQWTAVPVTLLLVVGLFAPATVTGADDDGPPNPRTILERAKQASGGSAWDGLRSRHDVATIGTAGLEGTVESWDDMLTGRGLSSYSLGPASGASGFDGTIHWSQDQSGQAIREQGADEVLGGVDDAYRRCLAYWFPERWPGEIAYAGVEKDGDRTFEVVSVTPKDGRPFSIWVDEGSGLIDRMVERTALDTRTTFFSDYRLTGGVRIPHQIRVTNGDSRYDQLITVKSVEFDVKLAADLFNMPAPPPPDYRFAGAGTSTTVPFELVNNHMYVDIFLNGEGPFRVICDTGGNNIVTPTLAQRLGLKPQGALQGRGVGEKAEDVGLVTIEHLSVGGVTLDNQLFFVFPLESFEDVEGVPQAGIIGYEVFKRFVVRIDYEGSRLMLFEPSAFRYQGDGTVLPFKFAGHMPQVEGTIDGTPGAFQLDTGSRASLTLLAPFVEKHGLAGEGDRGVDAVTGWGVGGAARGRVVRMKSLELGPVEIRDVVTDLSQQTKGAFSDPYVAGNVGAGVLKRFNIVFDYRNQTVTFERNATFSAPDVYDRSGMWLNRHGNALEVVDVTAGGPAAAAGLAAGDVILRIDGRAVDEVGLVALRRRFLSDPPGTEVHLLVRRGHEERDCVIVLRDLV